MSWGEPQQPDPRQPGPEQPSSGSWGNPAGPEGTQPYSAPPGPGQPYPAAPTQGSGGVPQQPDYGAPANPYARQPPYGAPPADPYAAQQQGFGAPPYGAQPTQFGGYQPPAPPPKKGKGLVIGLAVGAVVVIGGVVAAVALHSSPSPAPLVAQTSSAAPAATTAAPASAAPTAADTGSGSGDVALPQSAGGLTKLDTSQAKQAVSQVQSNLDSAGGEESQVYQNALIGAYGPSANSAPTTILVVQPLTNLGSDVKLAFQESSPSAVVAEIMTEAGATGVQPVQSTDSSAAISCGNIASSGSNVYTCSWVDEDTFGIAYFPAKIDPATAGQDTDALRNGADGD